MFRLLELLAELQDLRQMGMQDDEIEGFIEVFFDNLFDEIEIV